MRSGGPPVEGGYPYWDGHRSGGRGRSGRPRQAAALFPPSSGPSWPTASPLRPPLRPSARGEEHPFWPSAARTRADSDSHPLLLGRDPTAHLTLTTGPPPRRPGEAGDEAAWPDPAGPSPDAPGSRGFSVGPLPLSRTGLVSAMDQFLQGQPPGADSARVLFSLHLRWRGAPAADRLWDVASRAAPALLLLLGDRGRAPLALFARDGGLTLVGPGPLDERRSLLVRASVALLIHLSLIEPPDHLLAHPALCAPAQGGGVRIDQRDPGGRLRLRRGRLTELEVGSRGKQGKTRRATVAAQQSLTALILEGADALEKMLGEPDANAVRRAALGFEPLPADAVTDACAEPVRRPRPVTTPGKSSADGRLLVCVLDMFAEPLTGREHRPRWAALRVARTLSRSGAADVVVCPWHQARVRTEAVTIAGPVLLARDGRLVPGILPERVPAIMTFFPGVDHTRPGRTEPERAALASLAALGVRVDRLSRYGVVTRLLNEAAKRGAITNIPGGFGAWWRKDAQEYALRAHERTTGRPVPRPPTIVLSGRQLPAALRQLALAGRPAMVKPVRGSGGSQMAIVRPGDTFRPRDPDGRYVVQPVVPGPFRLAGHKADLRFYLLIDTASRPASRRLTTAFVRMAAASYAYGRHHAEITNSSLRLRARLPPAIWPLDEVAAWPHETRRMISERLDDLAEELLDAVFQAVARRRARTGRPPARRILFWGLDALLTGTLSDPSLEFLEVNTHPHLYRGARHCDETVDALFRYAVLPALLKAAREPARPAPRAARPPARPGGDALTLLTSRLDSPMPAMLAEACASRGHELHITSQPTARPGLMLVWGWDAPDELRRAAVRWLKVAGVLVLNPRIISKWRQLVALRQAGLPVPRSTLVLEFPQALAAGTEIGFPVVLKPLYGSYSWGVELIRSPDELRLAWTGSRRVIQEYLPSAGRCARLLVVDSQIVSAVSRVADDGFHATYDHGRRARVEAFWPTREEREIVIEACRALKVDIGGVDLVRTAVGPQLLEVNHRGVRFEESVVHGPGAIDFIAGYLCAQASAIRRAMTAGPSARLG